MSIREEVEKLMKRAQKYGVVSIYDLRAILDRTRDGGEDEEAVYPVDLTSELETELDAEQQFAGGNPLYAVRECRGDHWHVTGAGEDVPGERYDTATEAYARAFLLNRPASSRAPTEKHEPPEDPCAWCSDDRQMGNEWTFCPFCGRRLPAPTTEGEVIPNEVDPVSVPGDGPDVATGERLEERIGAHLSRARWYWAASYIRDLVREEIRKDHDRESADYDAMIARISRRSPDSETEPTTFAGSAIPPEVSGPDSRPLSEMPEGEG